MGKYFSPIIVIGMHRSGTSMIARVLNELGLFVGRAKDHNFESLFYQKANTWLLRQCGGDWDYPQPISHLLDNRLIRELSKKHLKNALHSLSAVSFCGLHSYLSREFPYAMKSAWGWKDPRNTFTLPIWLEIFPDAKILCIMRHGVDVAHSLLKRNAAIALQGRIWSNCILNKFMPYFLSRRIADSLRCFDLEGGFSLWEEYMSAASDYKAQFGNRFLHVKFEQILAAPQRQLLKVVEFCGLKLSKKDLEAATSRFYKDRALAYQRNEFLVRFSEKVKDRLSRYGY